MNHVVLVLVAGLITYLTRAGLIVVMGDRDLPTTFHRVVAQVKPAAFSAMAVTAMLRFPDLGLPHLVAAAIVITATLRGIDLLITMAMGMAVLLLLAGIS